VTVIVANHRAKTSNAVDNSAHIIRVPRFGTIASMPVCPTLVQVIRSHPADLVHIHTPNPGAALAFLLSRHSGRLVVTHHSDTLGRAGLRKLSDPFVYRVMKKASAIITTSSRYMETSIELADFRDKCHVIPLGIDQNRCPAAGLNKTSTIRSLYGERIILAVGRLVPYKGFDILIKAMKYIDGKLLLIGSGPESETLRFMVRSEGIEHKVVMLNSVDNVFPYYHAAQVFVLPSITRAEAFGLVQLEAMSVGLPVINTMIDSGVPEVSVHGETGFTIPPGDPLALVNAVNMVLNDQELRQRLGYNAMARVHDKFTADRMASQTVALYAKVLS